MKPYFEMETLKTVNLGNRASPKRECPFAFSVPVTADNGLYVDPEIFIPLLQHRHRTLHQPM